MCTAICMNGENRYFGRNLDLEISYNEEVTVTPRNYPFVFTCGEKTEDHYAMIGMATVRNNYPLYYEATNEKGLSIAGLNFPENAVYFPPAKEKDVYNVSPYEFIPWLLCSCADMNEARKKLEGLRLVNINFSEELPLSPLHWLVSDGRENIVVESVGDGLKLFDCPVGVMTNNPPYPYHEENIKNYMRLSRENSENEAFEKLRLTPYSLGMSAIGLPGDYSSASRFVRAAFVLHNSVSEKGEDEEINRFFHILSSVAMPKGCVRAKNGLFEYTRYSCCCNADSGTYYYTTYESRAVKKVEMKREALCAKDLQRFPI